MYAFSVGVCFFRLEVLDARATGDPGLLGTADVHLRDLGLQANQPAEAFWLPLKARLI